MADLGEDMIEQIRLAMNDLAATQVVELRTEYPAARWGVGKLAKGQHHDLPRFDWIEQGGTFEDASKSGVDSGSIAIDAARYEVTIWHSSVGNCRATMHNLQVAVRNASAGPNMQFGNYTFVEDANLKKGRKVKLFVTLRFGVSPEVAPTVEVLIHDHEVKVGSETVC